MRTADKFLWAVVVEGAVDHVCGRPIDRNPYSRGSAGDAADAWDYGWEEAAWVIDMRGQEEAARWLREAA